MGLLLLAHVIGLGLQLRNQRWLSWPPESRDTSPTDVTVSVIVPARNEADDIEQCLRSLLAQDHRNLKVIVVNDHSDDDTPQIIDRVAIEDARLVVVHNPPLQDGWLGKHNAMQAALEFVDSDLVVLTDADVEFNPACISSAVGELQTRELDLLSIVGQFQYVTFCETMLLPIYVGGSAILLSPAIENPKSSHAMAVGAFILVRTSGLQEIGGFKAIKSQILDDVGLARAFKKKGFRISLRSAPDLMRVRLFKDNRHAFFGVTKHLLGIVQGRIWLAPLLAIVPLLMYGTLLTAVVYGIAGQHTWIAGLAGLTLVIHYSALLLTRPHNQFNAFKALAFPCTSVSFAASCLRAAFLLAAKGKFEWRGRRTDLKAARDKLDDDD